MTVIGVPSDGTAHSSSSRPQSPNPSSPEHVALLELVDAAASSQPLLAKHGSLVLLVEQLAATPGQWAVVWTERPEFFEAIVGSGLHFCSTTRSDNLVAAFGSALLDLFILALKENPSLPPTNRCSCLRIVLKPECQMHKGASHADWKKCLQHIN